MTVANILTTIRLVLTPVFFVLFILKKPSLAILVFSVASFTDLIDGTVARMLKQPSTKGALLDPLADKLLLQTCFICLFFSGLLPLWFFLLALCRDIMIVGGILYLEYRRFKLPYRATLPSKFATLLQIALAIVGMLIWWHPEINISGFAMANLFPELIIATALFLIISGSQYVLIGLKIISNDSRKLNHD